MDKKTKIWIIALAAVCLVCIILFLLLSRLGGGTIAVVRVDGEEILRVNLSTVTQEYDYDVDTEYGHNTIHIAPGCISVSEADCPDGICVAQGAISSSGVPIICMPHHLTVKIESDDIDA